MPKQITQRVALEGGAEFRNGLKSLGDVGQDAFKRVKDAADGANSTAIRIAPTIDAIQKKLKALRTAAGEVGAKFSETKNELRETAERIAFIGVAAGGAAFAFGKLIADAGTAASTLAKTAEGLGITAQQYQHLLFIANQADMEPEQFTKALGRLDSVVAQSNKQRLVLQQQLVDLNEKYAFGKLSTDAYLDSQKQLFKSSTQIQDVFRRIGVSIYDYSKAGQEAGTQVIRMGQAATGLQPPLADNHTMLERLLVAWPKLDKAMQAVVATELGFSRNRQMVDFLNQGIDGFRRMEKEAERVAPALSDFELEIGAKLNDSLGRVQMAMTNVSLVSRLMFAPDLTRLADAFTEAIVRNRGVLIGYAVELRDRLAPIVEDAVKLLNGDEIDPNGVVARLRAGLLTFVNDVKIAAGVIAGAWQGLVSVLDVIARMINTVFGTQITGQALAIVAAFAAFTGILGSIVSVATLVVTIIGALSAAFGLVNVAIAAAGVALGYFLGQELLDLIDAAQQKVSGWIDAISSALNSVGDSIASFFGSIINAVTSKWSGFVDFILSSIDKIRAAMSTISSTFGFGAGAQGKADGGPIHGPGTGTSDSVPIWASNGEFMMRERAVSHYGLAFMDAINRMQVPRFNAGGLIGGISGALDSIVPRTRYADGGLVAAPAGGGGRPVVLKFGEQSFGPFTAGEDTVNRLERFAANRQARSSGRKPSWMGSR